MQAIVLLRYWREAIGVALLSVIAVLWLSLVMERRSAAKWQKRAVETQSAFDATVRDYRVKAERARLADLANKHRVEAEQERISNAIQSDYHKRLADLRARYDSLRAKAQANPGRTGTAPVSGVPGSPGGVDGAARCVGLPPEDALIASEQALRLKALQDWVREQTGVKR